MEKDIQRLTQKERLDLTDKQVKEENLAYTISAIENTLGILSTRQTIDDLKAENQRLKNELDKHIKYNRKLVRAVKFALNFLACPNVIDEDICNEQLAFDELRDVLKEVGEE